MKKSIMPCLPLLGLLAVCGPVSATVLLELEPADGIVIGVPGETVGWGFTLSNDADYLVLTSASFDAPIGSGTFTDYTGLASFFVVGPAPESPVVSQAFDAFLPTGLGSFAISPDVARGSWLGSTIIVTYDLFSVSPNDPNFNPDTDTLSVGNVLTADASVKVPEPETLWLFMAGLFGLKRLSKLKAA